VFEVDKDDYVLYRVGDVAVAYALHENNIRHKPPYHHEHEQEHNENRTENQDVHDVEKVLAGQVTVPLEVIIQGLLRVAHVQRFVDELSLEVEEAKLPKESLEAGGEQQVHQRRHLEILHRGDQVYEREETHARKDSCEDAEDSEQGKQAKHNVEEAR